MKPAKFLFLVFAMFLRSSAFGDEVIGIVLGTDGRPLAGAEVRLCSAEVLSAKIRVYDTVESDDAGHFVVNVPKSWSDSLDQWRQPLSLSVVSDQHGIGAATVGRNLPLPKYRVVVPLKKWTHQTISVKTDDGKPLVGREVQLTTLLGESPIAMPEGDWQSSAMSNEDGQVELLLPPAEDVGGLSVQLDDKTKVSWSRYQRGDKSNRDWYSELKLPKLKTIPVNFEFASDLRDIELQVSSTRQPTKTNEPLVSVLANSVPGKDNRSNAKVSLDSYIVLRNTKEHAKGCMLNLTWDSPLMTNSLDKLDIEYGEGTKMTAKIVDGTQKPAANIKVMLFSGFGVKKVSTDKDGRLSAKVAGRVMMVPAGGSGYRTKGEFSPQSAIAVPANKTEFDAGTIIVVKESKFVGIAQNADGTPAANANVFADWSVKHPHGYIQRQERTLKTDEKGRFEIAGLDVGQELRVGVWSESAASEKLESVSVANDPKPKTLRIAKSALTFASGRVTNHDETPAAGLAVQLRHRVETPLTDPQLPSGTDLDLKLTTDDRGEYKTDRVLPPWGEYIAVIHPASQREVYSGWKAANAMGFELPIIRKGFSRKVFGRIVNAEGRPIDGARVSLLTSNAQVEATTKSDGRFELDQLSGISPAIIAEAKGYLANGAFLSPESDPSAIELRLVKPHQAVAKKRVSKAGDILTSEEAMDQRRALALKLIREYDSIEERIKHRISSIQARYMPETILKQLDSLPSIKSQEGQMIRASLAVGLTKGNPGKAREILDEIPEGPGRLFAFRAFEEGGEFPDDVRMELLAQMVQDIRAMENPPYRVISMGFVAERLMDLGQRETGEQLLREAFDDAKELAPAAWSAYARGAFAEEMAQIDPDAAMELIEPIKDVNEFNRHLQNAAHEMAAIDPATAEAWLGKLRKQKEGAPQYIVDPRDGAVVRSCYRMVRVDPDRALRLARSIGSSSMRIYGFTVMAESLLTNENATDVDRLLARKIHDEAWDLVSKIRAEEDLSKVAWLYPSSMAATLCSVTESVAPEQLPYRVWQTIALRRPMEKRGNYQAAGQGCVCDMALMLRDVDLETARKLVAWLPSPEAASSFARFSQVARNAPTMLAELSSDLTKDVEAAMASLPDNQRAYVLPKMMGALIRSEEPRNRLIRQNMGLWYPDDEDHGPSE